MGINLAGNLILSKILKLEMCSQGLAFYYQLLIEDSDVVLRIAALISLVESGTLRRDQWPLLIENMSHGAIRKRAFRFFMDRHEYVFAKKAMETASQHRYPPTREIYMSAQFLGDEEKCAELCKQLFLDEGWIEHLEGARKHAEAAGGWRTSFPWAVTLMLAQPADPNWPFVLLNTLTNANQWELLEEAIGTLDRAKVYPMERAVFAAILSNSKGLHQEALKVLPKVERLNYNQNLAATALRVRAEAQEKLKEYREAILSYQRLNEIGQTKKFDPEEFYRGVARRASYRFDVAPRDVRCADHFMMLGFPRSGTTLLENALAAHPQVETFEELPSLSALFNRLPAQPSQRITATLLESARDAYYSVIDHYKRKPTAIRYIDKMPVNSAEAIILKRAFPERKYIFSIRHPYDVVLSCFKQMFKPNITMENFRTFGSACRLYDFAMARWFENFELTDPHVHYVRYELLVKEFETTLKDVLNFIEVPWDETVLSFASLAETRPMRTPSYQKVRAGLTIGIQSSWSNYAFLFERKEAAVLQRWVKHFGY